MSTRYKVIREAFGQGFVDRVQKALDAGWRPQGGIAVDPDDYVYQAFVIEENEPKPPEAP